MRQLLIAAALAALATPALAQSDSYYQEPSASHDFGYNGQAYRNRTFGAWAGGGYRSYRPSPYGDGYGHGAFAPRGYGGYGGYSSGYDYGRGRGEYGYSGYRYTEYGYRSYGYRRHHYRRGCGCSAPDDDYVW